ncbi:PREDICTED: probable importin-5 homolog [Nicotiana attenuata]|nr:PREDICTED: probable importin-5 homolog [Nicotiana attenuata]
MEAILGPDWNPFETFITNLMESFEEKKPDPFENLNSDNMSSSNEKVSEAKLMFNIMKQKNPESLVIKFANFLRSSNDIDLREKCVIILNKLLTEDDLCTWFNLSGSTQSIIKSVLLDRISLEASDNIELSYTVAKMAASFLPDNSWPELLPFLYQCVTGSSSNNYTKVSAFFILGILAEEIGETMVPC